MGVVDYDSLHICRDIIEVGLLLLLNDVLHSIPYFVLQNFDRKKLVYTRLPSRKV